MSPSGPSEVPAWVLRVNEAMERVWLVLRVSLVWLVLSILGLGVLGVAPASCAAAEVLAQSRLSPVRGVLRTMGVAYRRELVRANVRMVPLLVVQAAAGTGLWLSLHGVGPGTVLTVAAGIVCAVSAAWVSVSLTAIAVVPRLRRQDVLVTWRLALLMPGALPVRSVGLVLLLLLWSTLCITVPLLGLLVGAGTAIELSVAVFERRIVALLQTVDGSDAPTGGSTPPDGSAPRAHRGM